MATLTEMLRTKLGMEPENDTEAQAIKNELMDIKIVFRKWLKEVGLPDYYSTNLIGDGFNCTDSIRRLLIALVDEP